MQQNLQLDDVLKACEACIGQFAQTDNNAAAQVKAELQQKAQSYQEQANEQTEPLECTTENIEKVVDEVAKETCPGDELSAQDIHSLSKEPEMQKFNENVRANRPLSQEDLEALKKVREKNETPEEKESRQYFSKMGGFNSLADPKEVRKRAVQGSDNYKDLESQSLRKKKQVVLEQKWKDKTLEEEATKGLDAEELYNRALAIITSNLVQNYPRVSNITISDGYIVIDNTVIRFNINAFALPAQIQSYIEDDRYGYFVDWGYLAKAYKNSLATVNIDSMEYYVSNVGDTLGIGRRIGLSSLFNRFPNLLTVTIGNETIKADDLTKSPEKAQAMQSKLGKQKRSMNIIGGYKLNVCAGTNWLQDWSTGNLKTYMTSRGDKGILRFTGGVIARGGIALIGTTVNAAAHVTKGVFTAIKETFKAATTPVTEADMK